jgi:hypothetical protein
VDNHTPEMPRKRCVKCGKEFPATPKYFHKDKERKDGLKAVCRDCMNKKPTSHIPDGMKQCSKCDRVLPATAEYFTKVRPANMAFILGARTAKANAIRITDKITLRRLRKPSATGKSVILIKCELRVSVTVHATQIEYGNIIRFTTKITRTNTNPLYVIGMYHTWIVSELEEETDVH